MTIKDPHDYAVRDLASYEVLESKGEYYPVRSAPGKPWFAVNRKTGRAYRFQDLPTILVEQLKRDVIRGTETALLLITCKEVKDRNISGVDMEVLTELCNAREHRLGMTVVHQIRSKAKEAGFSEDQINHAIALMQDREAVEDLLKGQAEEKEQTDLNHPSEGQPIQHSIAEDEMDDDGGSTHADSD